MRSCLGPGRTRCATYCDACEQWWLLHDNHLVSLATVSKVIPAIKLGDIHQQVLVIFFLHFETSCNLATVFLPLLVELNTQLCYHALGREKINTLEDPLSSYVSSFRSVLVFLSQSSTKMLFNLATKSFTLQPNVNVYWYSCSDKATPKMSCFRSPRSKKTGSVGWFKNCFGPWNFGHGLLLSTNQTLNSSVAHPWPHFRLYFYRV